MQVESKPDLPVLLYTWTMLYTGVYSDEDEKDLILELKVMQHVGAHPNIVSLLGAAVHEGTHCLSR